MVCGGMCVEGNEEKGEMQDKKMQKHTKKQQLKRVKVIEMKA